MLRSQKFLILVLGIFLCLPMIVLAEFKGGNIIPKLPETPDDPILREGHVYPMWGAPCTRYTYSVIYQDKEGRPPEYMRMYFNGDWIDLQKENAQDADYKNGVKYIHQYVPTSTSQTMYFFEASNGKGKARDSIIDSPDNGPVLLTSAMNNNEIVVVNRETGTIVWRYPTGEAWVDEVEISRNNEYLAAKASGKVYLFKLAQQEPVWVYEPGLDMPVGGDVDGGIGISGDGTRITASLGNQVLLFSNQSNQPLWTQESGGSAYDIAISADGSTVAVATGGEEENENSNLLMVFDAAAGKLLWQYHSSGNFHSADLTPDGSLIAAGTGCPDRRAYIFSRNAKEPLIRSEVLTRDSPVHASAISDDGQYAAFGAESDDGAVHLFSKDSTQELWKFSVRGKFNVRTAAITPDGQYIGAATFGGNGYILSRESNVPLKQFSVQERLGAADLSDDGQYLAAGGSNKNLYLFSRESGSQVWQVALNEFINSLDISADGKFVAAGTGAAVYFFDSDLFNPPREQQCTEIYEPPAQPAMMGDGGPQGTAECGDDMCEPDFGENAQTCPQDCGAGGVDEKSPLWNRPAQQDKALTKEAKAGFPLLEVLLAVGGLAIIAVIVIILWRKGILGKIFRRKKDQQNTL